MSDAALGHSMRLYLDANASTPLAPEAFAAMEPWLRGSFGNPSSSHQAGQRARSAVEAARTAVATLLHATPREIVFTSGGTEADNLALHGVLQPFLDRREPAHLLTTAIEHHAVLHAAEALAQRGLEVTFVKPETNGVINPEALLAELRPHTRLISVMLANNETGALQPLGKIARLVKAAQPHTFVHTDAVQAAGKLPLDLTGPLKNVDFLTLSGHKLYGPQGTGALFVRKGTELAPLLFGGPQERQRRAGTENVAGLVGLGCAAQLASAWLETEGPAQLAVLRDRLEAVLLERIPGARIQAADAPRVPNTTSVTFPSLDAESLLIALDVQGLAASFGAACQSGATEPSHVLLAMGLSPAEARSSLRLSLLRTATFAEIDHAASLIAPTASRLRSL